MAALFLVCLLAGIGVAATWKHWWWPVRSARIWIDGKPASDVQVFRSSDGRYLLYRGNRLMTVHLKGRWIKWWMDPAIVSGRQGTVDEPFVVAPFERGWSDGAFFAFPFGVYSRRVPFDSSPMYYSFTELSYGLPHLALQRHGFTFYIHMSNDIGPGWDRAVPCRVETQ